MFISILKSKLHLVTVTSQELNYDGSCAIDEDWMDEVDIQENEQIHIYNQNNGERFITYAIRAPRGSGIISLNGAAARKAMIGDKLIIVGFGHVEKAKAHLYKPKVKRNFEDTY